MPNPATKAEAPAGDAGKTDTSPLEERIARLEATQALMAAVFVDTLSEFSARLYTIEVGLHLRSSAQVKMTGTDGINWSMGATPGSFNLAKANFKAELVKALGMADGTGREKS